MFNCMTLKWNEIKYNKYSCNNNNIPNPRCGCTLNYYNYKLYLFAGYCDRQNRKNKYRNELWIYNLNNNEWNLYDNSKLDIHLPRMNHHSTKIYKKYLIVFGGCVKMHNPGYICYNDIYIFNIKTNKWYIIQTDYKPMARFGHQMVIFKDYLFIHGGSNTNRDILNDAHMININDLIHSMNHDNNNKRKPCWIKLDFNIGCLIAHSFVSYNNVLLCFGGKNGENQRNNELHIIHNIHEIINGNHNLSGLLKGYIHYIEKIYNVFIPKEISQRIQLFCGILDYTYNIENIKTRAGHNTCMITYNNEIYLALFGGFDGKHVLSDCHFINTKKYNSIYFKSE